jgi:fructose/tagatose bisphosphate aldolase
MKTYIGSNSWCPVLRPVLSGVQVYEKLYDPRAYLKAAEASMAKRVSQACDDLKSTGKTLFV